MSTAISVSSRGKDIEVINDKDLSYKSDFLSFKIYKKGFISGTTDGSGNKTIRIAHGLNFTPTFRVWRLGTASLLKSKVSDLDANSYTNCFFPDPGNTHEWISKHDKIECKTDAENLIITISGADASTTYNFKYYIYSDLSRFFSGRSFKTNSTHGISISKEGKAADDVEIYDKNFSSEFDYLKYNPYKKTTAKLSLPALFGSTRTDPLPEEMTYVDIFHYQKFPPNYLVFIEFNNYLLEEPYQQYNGEFGAVCSKTSSFCDKDRIRISWWRQADANGTAPFVDPIEFIASSLTFRVIIFDEDLRL